MNRGGTARWLDVLTEGLNESGNDCVLIAGAVQGAEIEDLAFRKANGIHISNLGKSVSPLNDIKAFIEIRRAIKKYRPEVINTHTSKAGALGRIATIGLGRNRPTVVHTFHGHLLYGYFGIFKKFLVISIERLLSNITDLYISSGSIVRNELLEVGIGKPEQYVVVKPGIPELRIESRASIRQQWNIQNNQIVVGWLGRMVDIKRPERVLEIAQSIPDVTFIMSGDGELLSKISHEAPPNIIFTGWSTPEIVWGVSDIALLTSENEAQPISLVEAGYAGLPCVALGVGSISEVIEHGVTGYLGSTVEELATWIEKLANDSLLRKSLGSNAHTKMLGEFSVESFINGHLAAYKRAIAMTKK